MLASSHRLLSELIVEPERGPHGFGYSRVYLLVELELRLNIDLELGVKESFVLWLRHDESLDGCL